MEPLQIALIVAAVIFGIVAVLVQARIRVHGYVDLGDFFSTLFLKKGWYTFLVVAGATMCVFAFVTFPLVGAIFFTIGYGVIVIGFAVLLIMLAVKKKAKLKAEKEEQRRLQEEAEEEYQDSLKPKTEVVTTNYTCPNCGDKIQKRTTIERGKILKVEYFCDSCGVTFTEKELEASLKAKNVSASALDD